MNNSNFKFTVALCFIFNLVFSMSVNAEQHLKIESIESLSKKHWFSGNENCATDQHDAIDIYQFNVDTYILRQNKCVHFEAPFMYLLFGEKQALLIDSGATRDDEQFPLASTVSQIIKQRALVLSLPSHDLPLLIAHSHSHSDHISADSQFAEQPLSQVISPNNLDEITTAFSIKNWPERNGTLNLGKRKITIIPTPGHQKEAITFYDQQTQWLLTGDSLYPGRLYVRQWQAFKDSIARLVVFSKEKNISAILGAHIEMTNKAKVDYPMGSTFQPNEASLVMHVKELIELNEKLKELGDVPTKSIHDNFIIFPVDS